MKCPWPALRAARAMREAADMRELIIRADDPIAEKELRALAVQQGWTFAVIDAATFRLSRPA
jgi:tRNA 2-thiouridine synthesizing protein A